MRIRGKYFVPVFAIFIAVFLTFVWTIFARHAAIGESVKQERSEWPQTAEVLKRQFDAHSSAAEANPDIASVWSQAKKEFEESSIFDNQASSARRLCSLLEVKLVSDSTPLDMNEKDVETLQKFIALDQHREALESDFLGKLTYNALILNYPEPIYPSLTNLLNKRAKD
jgi:hypothetical protein